MRELLQGESIQLQRDALPYVKVRNWTFQEIRQEWWRFYSTTKRKVMSLRQRRRTSIVRSIRKTRNKADFGLARE
jgi:hypothetical protein